MKSNQDHFIQYNVLQNTLPYPKGDFIWATLTLSKV